MKRTYLRATSDLVFHAYAWARERDQRIGDLAERIPMTRIVLQGILGRGRPLPNTELSRKRLAALAKATGFQGETTEVVELRAVR